ncbi:hypothetical protein [Legionella pneumophila]|uniref:hypothetical protein n=1 Tax=Legionella pneumophila TaxID=446 RepID=UPI00048DF12B|nr:hypothetical protein [Legionella pneumophila]RYB34932.1 hypothetical protein D7242_11345 [Legionella pneumophila]RYW28603.1 hypothetical protein D7234_06660 [Legionella pneumophila]HAT1867293.1 hypothetical protein [Legionella pneumophila]HAT1907420.1 hypothetical protein [Legionella pneumophila]HAT1916895.1 hypothetical protein [Legionella pneumophila]
MIKHIKPTQSVVFRGLKILGKVSVLALQAIAAFVSDESKKPRLTAGKAQQLYEDGVISGTELAEHIHGD